MKDGFNAEGEVCILRANIGACLDCRGGIFENPNGAALCGDGFTIKGDVSLRDGFKAKGEVSLLGVNIGGCLVCEGGEFENPNGDALAGTVSRYKVMFS